MLFLFEPIDDCGAAYLPASIFPFPEYCNRARVKSWRQTSKVKTLVGDWIDCCTARLIEGMESGLVDNCLIDAVAGWIDCSTVGWIDCSIDFSPFDLVLLDFVLLDFLDLDFFAPLEGCKGERINNECTQRSNGCA